MSDVQVLSALHGPYMRYMRDSAATGRGPHAWKHHQFIIIIMMVAIQATNWSNSPILLPGKQDAQRRRRPAASAYQQKYSGTRFLTWTHTTVFVQCSLSPTATFGKHVVVKTTRQLLEPSEQA